MNNIHAALLRDQMARDTIWCLPCGMREIARRADCTYTVEQNGLSAKVHACRECLQRELQNVPIVASEPVVQPAYIGLLEAAITA